MVVRYYKIKDIKEYEIETGRSILELVNKPSINNIIELIKLGNNKCSDDRAFEILEKELKEKDLIQIIKDIQTALFGRENEGEEGVPIDSYKTMTDIYTDICMQMMSYGISYSEFWEMTTVEMHKVFTGIIEKIQNDMNRDLQLAHTTAAMIGAAVWGKLDREPPKVSFSGNEDKKSNEDDDGTLEVASHLLKLLG